MKFDYLYLFCLSGNHDGNCPACIPWCKKVCEMDSDFFEPMFEAFGPDLFQFADCLHYYTAYFSQLGDDYDTTADYDSYWTPEHYDYDNDMGCSHGKMWANDKSFSTGEMGPSFSYCINMADHMRYQVADYSVASKDIVYIPLDRLDSLVIGMNWYDDTRIVDNRQCLGEYTYYPRDIEEIATMDNQEKIYERGFIEHGGGV